MTNVIERSKTEPLIDLIIGILDDEKAVKAHAAAEAEYGAEHPITKAFAGEVNKAGKLERLHDFVATLRTNGVTPDLSGANPTAIASRHKVSMRKIADWRKEQEKQG